MVDPAAVAHLICIALSATAPAPVGDGERRLLEDVLTQQLGADALVDVKAAIDGEGRDAAAARLATRLVGLPRAQLEYLAVVAGGAAEGGSGGGERSAEIGGTAATTQSSPIPIGRASAGAPSPADATAVIRAEQRHIADITTMLGPDHPDTLAARLGLARVYRWAGREYDAIRVLERVLADRERLFTAGHPDTLAARTLLRRWRAALKPQELPPL
ncbi:hypothetical protein Val02_10080 [Virgisporangium aliadipatigenens]|uniref:Tetratricopeptide repeat protein n=1 Tax=Virgisporangium aliadipatigenens TaxID=741659 RepID=A0A8J3YH32_9ACTN|nr:tetratricopeptide repeat protein [Virgisporangium aliadipatigenens]GIJ44122.1 hypothetical protein Val02_10080 [Virgisporangium aliadipatigenens]